uniref:FP protein C-terminal domain-containing protein n=1 Tax=Cacopsylla melanoneura TaxID=428564 RepID=A0A8D8YVU2_9HEMI
MACFVLTLLLMISVYCLNAHDSQKSSLGDARKKEQSMMGPEANMNTGNEEHNEEQSMIEKLQYRMRREAVTPWTKSENETKTLYPLVMDRNIVVSGAHPVGKNESIMRRVEQIGQRIGIQEPLKDVRQAWRIWLPSVQKQVLIIKLRSKKAIVNWMIKYRKRKLWEEKLYMNEQMTKEAYSLVRHSKQLAKKHNWSHVWIQKGRIFLRQTNLGAKYKVESFEHLYHVMNISTTRPLHEIKMNLTTTNMDKDKINDENQFAEFLDKYNSKESDEGKV